ncbi:hypothetical protein JDV02_002353 [Purpureocillium takamizusanense]|uniref:Uncharacterized protein n=1 Tax=Purpureocillium takamizusanense TaxID=2060973 RepID=A0A9Q8QBL7_9HYPO|nr:uncharacterized protein JDV02_002353 [Purpureocillium takamizusanense]UNI15862.1 hypothetical protein JDV02_002353 [Purpureocillium takamizusanense]
MISSTTAALCTSRLLPTLLLPACALPGLDHIRSAATSPSGDKLVPFGAANLELDAGREDTCMSRPSLQKKCTRPVSHPSSASDTPLPQESRDVSFSQSHRRLNQDSPPLTCSCGNPARVSHHTPSAVFQTNLYNGLVLLFQQTPRATRVDCHFPPCERLRYLQNGTSRVSTAQETTVRLASFWTDYCRTVERRLQAAHTRAEKANDGAFLGALSPYTGA